MAASVDRGYQTIPGSLLQEEQPVDTGSSADNKIDTLKTALVSRWKLVLFVTCLTLGAFLSAHQVTGSYGQLYYPDSARFGVPGFSWGGTGREQYEAWASSLRSRGFDKSGFGVKSFYALKDYDGHRRFEPKLYKKRGYSKCCSDTEDEME
ncbi:hypothetical protein FGB62_50g228 [Gracilaria domingensis]|nr:hypothetical protein FGB62_50g228 [Gracilaria domingensis]